MTTSHVSITGNNNASSQNDNITESKSFTSGQVVIMGVWWRDSSAQTLSAPTWNGQTFTQIGTTLPTGEGKFALYRLIASSTATANVVASFSAFVWFNSFIEVLSVSGAASFSALTTQTYNSPTFTAPSQVVSSVPSGALLISVLAAMGWDKDYNDVSATVWTSGGGMTDRLTSKNTSTGSALSVTSLRVQTAAGTGSNLTPAWSNNANQPQYLHIAFYVNDGIAYTIDTMDNPLPVGGTVNITTTNLGTLTTASNIGGKAVASVSAPSGDGTVTLAGFANGVTYPAMGTQTFTASDGTNTATISRTLAPMSGYTAVVVAGIDRGNWSIGKDTNVQNGDEIHLPFVGMNPDTTLTDVAFGTYTMWRRDVSDGKMYTSTLTVSNSGITIITQRNHFVGIGIGIGL